MKEPRPEAVEEVFETLIKYKPGESENGVIEFEELLRDSHRPEAKKGNSISVRVADFAEFGYCPYKAWHHGRGSREVRSRGSQAALARGAEKHAKAEQRQKRVLASKPIPTATDLSNMLHDLEVIPEFDGKTRLGDVEYRWKADTIGRSQGHLVVGEFKTGRWKLMPNHYLQVWAYSTMAPQGVTAKFGPGFKADRVFWYLEYERLQAKLGPFPFAKSERDLLTTSMSWFEWLYRKGLQGSSDVPNDLPGPDQLTCTPCSFKSNCRWQTNTTSKWSASVVPAIEAKRIG